ncbi:MAG TPA: S41 family peptidase [Cyclobacteriaceae bacterium]|nr:S41 family peptidase [Cyclobacteriaceae bacterium]
MIFKWRIILGFGILSVLSAGCRRENEDPIDYNIPEEIRSVNNFIYDNMKFYYLWNSHIPGKLNPNTEPDPKVFFGKMIYEEADKWSFITDDYEGLLNSFSGISKSFGHQYRLFLEQDSYKVFGIVEYVVAGSPADSAGIRRGDIFTEINDVRLTVDNYRSLLFNLESCMIGFASLIDGELVPNGIKTELTAVTIAEDPVYLFDTLDVEGYRIGYLVYNQFITNYDDELRSVFQAFKSAVIDELVIDLRYNPGGSVSSSRLLASMIAPPDYVNQSAVFAKFIWNSSIHDYILREEGTDSENLVLKFLPAETVNNIGIDRVFIITTDNTASASELLINALEPYMEVITIGVATAGKYTASITLHDQEESYNWAIQPIVLKTANALNVSDYINGFMPDYPVEDDYFSDLGTIGEDMLGMAVSLITGMPSDALARNLPKPALPGARSWLSASGREVKSRQVMYIGLSFP